MVELAVKHAAADMAYSFLTCNNVIQEVPNVGLNSVSYTEKRHNYRDQSKDPGQWLAVSFIPRPGPDPVSNFPQSLLSVVYHCSNQWV